jgi:hypothetical protein
MIAKTVKAQVALISMILAAGMFLPISPTLAHPKNSGAVAKPTIVNLAGTVRVLAVEGTCYQFVGDNGKKYELMGKFPKVDGTRLQVRGVLATDTATICQVGQLIKVKGTRVIK